MMNNRLFFLLPVLLLSSCNPDKIVTKIDSLGVTVQLSPVWRSSVSEKDKYVADDIGQAVVTDKGVLFPKGTALPRDPQYSRSYVVLKDKETGDDLWTWNDFFTDFERFSMYKSRQENLNGILFHTSGNRGYGIAMQSGKSTWKFTYPNNWGGPATTTGESNFYFTLNSSENDLKKIFKPDLYEGNLARKAVGLSNFLVRLMACGS
jgi:hypothetical protein